MGSNARFQKLMEQEIEILKWWEFQTNQQEF